MKKTFLQKIAIPLRRSGVLLFCCYFFCSGIYQSNKNDILKQPGDLMPDSIKVDQLNALGKKYWMKNFDSSIYYAQKALQLSQALDYKRGIAESWRVIAVANMNGGDRNIAKQYMLKASNLFTSLADENGMAATWNNLGLLHNRNANYPIAQTYFDSALAMFRKLANKEGQGSVLNYIGINYQDQGNYQKAIDYCLQAFEIRKEINDHPGVVFSLLNVGNMYLDVGQTQTALTFYNQGVTHAKEHSIEPPGYLLNQIGKTYLRLKQYDKAKTYLVRTINGQSGQISDHLSAGELYAETGKPDSAIKQFKISLEYAFEGDYNNKALSLVGLSKVFLKKGDYGLALSHAKTAYDIADSSKNKLIIAESANVLAAVYKIGGDYKKSIQFFELAHSITDSVTSENYLRKLAFTESKNEIENEQAHVKLLSAEKKLQAQKLKDEQFLQKLILIIFAVVVILSFIIIRNINAKRKKIQSQKDHIELQSIKVESAYEELKSTQSQLIQREKMASLGELTAGIAHEIQNPLNFVNNFSELNSELLAELKEELGSGNFVSAKQIAGDIEGNEEKINFHGRRADSIVKSMLQHSKASSGAKEPTDINALAEEFLRLSFHGFRAKEKLFNATINTSFDKSIGKVEVMPQDLGRVLLNLFNNSFYSMNEKKKKGTGDYEPIIQITTTKTSSGVEIIVKDNGTGIPEKLLQKIYQPFFTTKPTGEGTGLGLSLSYDIITKGHGGEM
jgi:signal transduction histidine kinase